MKTNYIHIGNDVLATCAHSAKLERFPFLYKLTNTTYNIITGTKTWRVYNITYGIKLSTIR
jgi:hypothetical protein